MDSQLTIALHILGCLASRGGQPLTSEVLASSYGTSPVVLRRVLAKLKRAGLVKTQRGVGGGSVLARDPANINLRQAFEAVSEAPQLLHRYPSECSEPISEVLCGYVNELFVDAERVLLERLQKVTVSNMDREVRSRLKSKADLCNIIGREARQANPS